MKDIVSLKNNTLTTFVGALAGGAIVMAAVYAMVPSARPAQATPAHHVAASNAVNNNDNGLGSCTVTSGNTGTHQVPAVPSYSTVSAPVYHHTTYPVAHHVYVPVPVPGNTTNTNSSSATANHNLVGAAVNALNNSLNGNEVNVPVLSGNDIGVLNNSNILSGNDVLSDNDGNLNHVLNGNSVVKAVTNITGGLL